MSNVTSLAMFRERQVRRLAESLGLTLTKNRGGWYELWGWIGDGPGGIETPGPKMPGSARWHVSQDLTSTERYLQIRAAKDDQPGL